MNTNGDPRREIEASRAHRALLANLRHELRTPLNAIIGYSEMLLEDAEAGGQDACVPDLQKIHAAGRQLLELVNRILDPAKVEAGALDMDLAALEADLRHELLTPITSAIGYTEMLLEDTSDCAAADSRPTWRRISRRSWRPPGVSWRSSGTSSLPQDPGRRDGRRRRRGRGHDPGGRQRGPSVGRRDIRPRRSAGEASCSWLTTTR